MDIRLAGVVLVCWASLHGAILLRRESLSGTTAAATLPRRRIARRLSVVARPCFVRPCAGPPPPTCVSIPSLQIAFDPTYAVQRAVAAGSALTDDENVETLVSARRADGGTAHCFQLDAAADAWALIFAGIAFWGLCSDLQRSWSSGGREFYGPLQALRRRPDLFRDAFLVIGFDTLALCLGRARVPSSGSCWQICSNALTI